MFDGFAARLKLVTGASFALFVTGTTAPTSNVGPWWNGSSWYYWDDVSGSYKPQILAPASLGYTIGANPPDPTVYRFWISTTLAGAPLALNIYYNGAWTDVYASLISGYVTTASLAATLANYPTITDMNTAIANAIAAIVNYPAQGTGGPQTIAIDGTPYKLALTSAPINPAPAPFDTTNRRYIAPVDGTYDVAVSSQFDNDTGSASGMQVVITLYKNGAPVGNGLEDIDNTPSPNGSRWSPGFAGKVQMTAGEYIEVFAVIDDGVNLGNITLTVAQLSVGRST